MKAGILCDPGHPVFQRQSPVEAVRGPEEIQVNILRPVLGRLPAGEVGMDDATHEGMELGDEFPRRRFIAVANPSRDERSEGVGFTGHDLKLGIAVTFASAETLIESGGTVSLFQLSRCELGVTRRRTFQS